MDGSLVDMLAGALGADGEPNFSWSRQFYNMSHPENTLHSFPRSF